MDIHLSPTAGIPIYQQIVEQTKELVASRQLCPGERLPTVRNLAHCLGINVGTVTRAYVELEREGVVSSRRGGGTIVSAQSDNPQVMMVRQARLASMASGYIMEGLSRGYSPEELEATFTLHLARWREERKGKDKVLVTQTDTSARSGITIAGSYDLALDLLISQLRTAHPRLNVDVTWAGSLGGLIAIQENRADVAGIHLLDEETGEYNYPYVRHVLPGRATAIVNLAYRVQGLMVAAGNPKQISGVADLRRSDVTFVNRQKGSGARVLLDLQLRQHRILPSDVAGYDRELSTDLAVAIGIARGEADVGLGIQAVAQTCSLNFLPLSRERYDLVIPMESYRDERSTPLLEAIGGDDFKRVVQHIEGYDVSETGVIVFQVWQNRG
jgi:putative molybdopterin biosynthesis protein